MIESHDLQTFTRNQRKDSSCEWCSDRAGIGLFREVHLIWQCAENSFLCMSNPCRSNSGTVMMLLTFNDCRCESCFFEILQMALDLSMVIDRMSYKNMEVMLLCWTVTTNMMMRVSFFSLFSKLLWWIACYRKIYISSFMQRYERMLT
jgi:hypothetical protein